VLTLTLGQAYDSTSFASLLTAFATVPNFRGVAVLSESGRLVAYSSVRQISWLASDNCSVSRDKLLAYIFRKNEDDIIKHISMSVITASNGSSYADVLERALEDNLTCIAIVDKYNRLCGIIDRDRLSAALVLSLTLSAQGKDAGRVGDDIHTAM
jgi:CBS-domain-containing membrane protein